MITFENENVMLTNEIIGMISWNVVIFNFFSAVQIQPQSTP